jgi:uncharacterized repeat protein (TIGR01451 family)
LWKHVTILKKEHRYRKGIDIVVLTEIEKILVGIIPLLVVLIISFSISPIPSVDSTLQKPFLTIFKEISNNNFTWNDEVKITIQVTNEGNGTANNIIVTDYYPAVFDVLSNRTITANQYTITFNKTIMKAGETYAVSYSIVGKQGTEGNTQMTLLPAEVKYMDAAGNTHFKKSDEVNVTLRSSSTIWPFVGSTVSLLVLSFVSGASGSAIHRLNMKQAEKEDHSTIGYILLGGVAGVLVLAAFQGLSDLFSNGSLKITSQSQPVLFVLIGTSIAAGFVPQEVIDNATEKYRKKAKAAEDKATAISSSAETIRKAGLFEDKRRRGADKTIKNLQRMLDKANAIIPYVELLTRSADTEKRYRERAEKTLKDLSSNKSNVDANENRKAK